MLRAGGIDVIRRRTMLPAILAVAAIGGDVTEARAQGCILIRGSAPVIGSPGSTYLRPGEWELDVSLRQSTADRHYSGDVFQAQRTALGTNVVNKQHILLFNVSHAFTSRFSTAVSVPIISASWSIPSPIAPAPGPRATQHGRGLGDLYAIGRYWIFNPLTHARFNLSVGAGVKVPTGGARVTDVFPDISGASPSEKAVDQSVQPGDGGWGGQFELQGFSRVGPLFAFGSANYVTNPRNFNETPSILVGLGRPSATQPMRNINSVPDQYIVRGGVGVPIWRGLGASLAVRAEGVPRYDLFGRSDGFKRPGREVFLEPGITYSQGHSTLQLNLPHGVYRYRAPDPYTGAAGDATFPDWVVLGTYAYRFGKVKHVAMPTPPTQP